MKNFSSVSYANESRERLLKYIDIDEITGCWIWNASSIKLPSGGPYARFSFKGVTHYAHRVSYELAYGPIPINFTIDHLCRVTLCVNPEHLEAVTQAENNRRAPKHIVHGDDRAHGHGLPNKIECVRGHARSPENLYSNGNCKLCKVYLYQQRK